MRRFSTLAALLGASACGRLDFDATGTSDASGDALVVDPTLVLWLRMDEAPDNGAILDSARGHAVSCSTCPVLSAGVHGMAYDFVASTSQVVVDHTADLDTTSGFTIAAWIRVHAYPATYAGAACKPLGSGDDDTFCVSVDSSMEIFYYSNQNGSGGDFQYSTSMIALESWHHVAMTWDGTTKHGYLDGVAEATSTTHIDWDTNPIVVGADNVPIPEYPLDGVVDDLRLYDRALSAAEIAVLAAP